MKNWLIRTRQKQILGPITREKVLELLDKGAINPEDELCSGNGHWIYAKEKNLLELYVFKGNPQPFNPISEAKTQVKIDQGSLLELQGDVEQPSESAVDSTVVFDRKSLNSEESEDSGKLPESLDFDVDSAISIEEKKNSEIITPQADLPQINLPEKTSIRTESQTKQKVKTNRVKSKTTQDKELFEKNDRYLFVLAIASLVLIIGIVFYYKKLINRPLPIPGIDNADAQVVPKFESLSKKKRFLN